MFSQENPLHYFKGKPSKHLGREDLDDLFNAPVDDQIKKALEEKRSVWNLNERKIAVLPQEFFLLTTLRVIHLSNNRLTAFPPQLGELSQLQVLDLSCNQLKEIPSEIGSLKQLTCLMLYNNKLTMIPYSIGNLTELEYLSVG